MKRVLACLGWLACAAPPATAEQDYISSQGKLSDDAFYKMVACGAPENGNCVQPLVRWPKDIRQSVSIGITRQDDSFPPTHAELVHAALNTAIAEINSVKAGVRLVRNDNAAMIQILLLDMPAKSRLTGTGVDGLDGRWMDAAYVHIWWNGRHELVKAVIVISPAVAQSAVTSVVLEEVVQALGLLTDISNPDYKGRSIFDQHTNAVTRLSGQDAMVLHRHYSDKETP